MKKTRWSRMIVLGIALGLTVRELPPQMSGWARLVALVVLAVVFQVAFYSWLTPKETP